MYNSPNSNCTVILGMAISVLYTSFMKNLSHTIRITLTPGSKAIPEAVYSIAQGQSPRAIFVATVCPGKYRY